MVWYEKFNKWRKNYDKMTYQDQQKFYTKLLKAHPHQSQFSKEYVPFFLNWTNEPSLFVLELGGWDGELAQKMMYQFQNILRWDNYELTELAKEISVCKDTGYTVRVPDDFMWNVKIPDEFNVFIASHVIEHIKAKELEKLITNLPKGIKYIYFESPIGQDWDNGDWTDDYSTHILEWGWKALNDCMGYNKFKLEIMLPDIRIYKRIEELK